MSKEIRHINGDVQSSRTHSGSIFFRSDRPDDFSENSHHSFSEKSNPNRVVKFEDHRGLIFNCLSDPTYYLLKLKNQPPGQRLKAYGTLFRSYWENMDREAEVNGKPTERWGSYLRGLEEARRAFRRDFPSEEFPI